MKRTILSLALVASVAACAQTPTAIAPVSMGNAYDGISCSKARALLAQERAIYTGLAQQQNGAVVGDAVGVLLIGVPVSSLTGSDVTGEIAATKGKALALEQRLLSC